MTAGPDKTEDVSAEGLFTRGELAEKRRDFDKARSCYEEAAAHAHPLAAWRLACLRRHGLDVMDDQTAMRWLKQSASAGHIPSRFLLVRQIWNGRVEGGRFKAVGEFFRGLAHVFGQVITGNLRAGDRRLQK